MKFYNNILEKLKSKELAQNSDCFKTASAITSQFIGKQDKPMDKVFLDEEHLNSPLEESNTVFQRLYGESKEIEHTVFNIDIYPKIHAFVIEKESDGKATVWRIYQSWEDVFTLSQWLNIDPWPSKQQQIDNIKLTRPNLVNYVEKTHDFNNKLYAQFGMGNALSSNEIKAFIVLIFDFCKQTAKMSSYIKLKSEPGNDLCKYLYEDFKFGNIKVFDVQPQKSIAQHLTTFGEVFHKDTGLSPHDNEDRQNTKNLTLN